MIAFSASWDLDEYDIPPKIVLDICLHHLQSSYVPRSSTSAFTKRARFAYAAIVAISGVPLGGNCDGAIERGMALAWDGIRAWAAFIFTTRVAGLPESNPDRAPALEALVQILQFYISHSVLHKLLLRDISTHELAARLWIEWGSTKGSSDSDTFKDFKPVTYDVSTQLKAIDAFQAKAVRKIRLLRPVKSGC